MMTKTKLGSSGSEREASADGQGAATPTAVRSEVLHWESLAWMAVGAAWVVSAWPGLLVEWDGLAVAAMLGLGVLAGFGAWQIVVHGARVRPSGWVGYRWRAARPGRRPKSRHLLAVTVILDAAAWSASGIGWCVAARVFDWSETVTGAPLQVAFGVAFLGWGLLHIPAARRLAGSDEDLVIVGRRVLGSGPPAVDTRAGETGHLATAARTKQRRARVVQRWLLNPPMRALTYLGLLRHHAVLETTGRHTGRSRRTVVGIARQSDTVLWIVAEHGRRAGYVHNLDTEPNVRLHIGRRWQAGSARVVDNDDIDARLEHFIPRHANAIRRFSTELATVRVDLVA